MARRVAAVLDLGPPTATALDHTGPVAATKVPVSVGGIARAVGASLIATEARTTDITSLDLRDCRSSDGDGGEQSEEGGDLHLERCTCVAIECGKGLLCELIQV